MTEKRERQCGAMVPGWFGDRLPIVCVLARGHVGHHTNNPDPDAMGRSVWTDDAAGATPAPPDPEPVRPDVIVANPGDLVMVVLPDDVETETVTELADVLAQRVPAGVEHLVLAGPRVVVVRGETGKCGAWGDLSIGNGGRYVCHLPDGHPNAHEGRTATGVATWGFDARGRL